MKALAIGDYATAARILRPLAEASQEPDGLAQFFMAILYDSGLGRNGDPIQACVFYMRAARSENPLMSQSLALGQAIQEHASPLAARLCSQADDDRLPQPVSFTLGPDHSIVIDRTGATVIYKGESTRSIMAMGDPDSVFLPTRHTSLTVSRPANARRDFIEWSAWRRDKTSDQLSWTLGWVMFEVSGPDLVFVATEDLLSVTALQPPAVPDISRLARVEVDANGEAAWIVSSGPVPHGAVIPPHSTSHLVADAKVIPAPLPRAQTAIEDAVEAFVRRDYQRAAGMFDLLANKSPQPNRVADFFLATMYENGLGVPADPMRACASYVRASISGAPLGWKAGMLADPRRLSLSSDAVEDCHLYAFIGFDHHFRPETFSLEQGHSISWDLKGATITYQGKETRIKEQLARPGAVFLPLQHTELATGSLRSSRRHFIEVFMWLPKTEDKQEWSLLWRLFEVTGNKLESITSRDLATISAPEPEIGPPFDVRKFVRLRVNNDGDAEWIVPGRPDAQSATIETAAERQAAIDQKRAREDAEARMDWTRVRDVYRPPALTYPNANGCGNVFVFGWSTDRDEAISVSADKNLLQLSTTPLTFDAAIHQSGLEVLLHVYERPVRNWPFCTDVHLGEVPQETWRMARGTVTIVLLPPDGPKKAPRATIQIAGAEFVSSSGARMTQVKPIALTAALGSGGGGYVER